jgi:hypothetical protein
MSRATRRGALVGACSLMLGAVVTAAGTAAARTDDNTATGNATSFADAAPELDFGCTRIAWSSDGNYHDRDDIGGSAMALALLAERGQQSRLVHWDYNSHLGSSITSWEKDMTTATVGTATQFGDGADQIFRDSQENLTAAVTHLRAVIDASTASNTLCLVGAGPMGVIYRALDGSNTDAHQHVTLISHSTWNNNHDDDDNKWNLADIRRDLPQVGYTQIPDQNPGLGTGGDEAKWSWMADNTDARLQFVHNVVNNIMNKKGDVSDAGMMYFIITGDKAGNASKLRSFLTAGPQDDNSGPAATIQAEAFTSQSGVQPAQHSAAQSGATLGYVNNQDWAGYATISTSGKTRFSARVSSGTNGGTIQIRSGSADGPLLGTVAVPTTGGWTVFRTVSTSITPGNGPLFLRFTGTGTGFLFDIDAITLS